MKQTPEKAARRVRPGTIVKIDTAELRRRMQASKTRSVFLPGETMVLHVWTPVPAERARAPLAFRMANRWAHLFGDDVAELKAIARLYGVNRAKVGRRGERGQHVDLCGRPLERLIEAIEACEKRGGRDAG
jgi:hypothetical protein